MQNNDGEFKLYFHYSFPELTSEHDPAYINDMYVHVRMPLLILLKCLVCYCAMIFNRYSSVE